MKTKPRPSFTPLAARPIPALKPGAAANGRGEAPVSGGVPEPVHGGALHHDAAVVLGGGGLDVEGHLAAEVVEFVEGGLVRLGGIM